MEIDVLSNDLSFLLVSEAVRVLEKRYDGMNDKNLHIEANIYNIGTKPGFAIAAQLCLESEKHIGNTANDVGKFISTVLSPKIFGQRPRIDFTNPTLTIAFSSLPPCIKCLTSADGTFDEQQTFWFKCYSSFIAGVFAGALSHFGYKVRVQISPPNSTELVIKFDLEPLDGAWTFSSTMQH